jgi:hypothetical protein
MPTTCSLTDKTIRAVEAATLALDAEGHRFTARDVAARVGKATGTVYAAWLTLYRAGRLAPRRRKTAWERGASLKTLLRERCGSVKHAAAAAGLSYHAVCRWTRGQRPPHGDLARLLDAAGVPAGDFDAAA